MMIVTMHRFRTKRVKDPAAPWQCLLVFGLWIRDRSYAAARIKTTRSSSIVTVR